MIFSVGATHRLTGLQRWMESISAVPAWMLKKPVIRLNVTGTAVRRGILAIAYSTLSVAILLPFPPNLRGHRKRDAYFAPAKAYRERVTQPAWPLAWTSPVNIDYNPNATSSLPGSSRLFLRDRRLVAKILILTIRRNKALLNYQTQPGGCYSPVCLRRLVSSSGGA